MTKRTRKSMFEPYREQIIKWCAQGETARYMTEQLEEMTGQAFYEQAVYAYIYTHKLRYAPYFLNRNCNECEYCHKYINTNNTEGRICTKHWKTIQPNVKNSPKWCANENREQLNEEAEI